MQIFQANLFTEQQFNDDKLPFLREDYSLFKFGNKRISQKYGTELANKFYETYKSELINRTVTVLPSPFNFIQNAAMNLSIHFMNRLNYLLAQENAGNIRHSIIHRTMTYFNDYGKMDKSTREKLIGGDEFFFNSAFLCDTHEDKKITIFLDDIRITGAHERQIIKKANFICDRDNWFFVYFANLEHGEHTSNPQIENGLNFAAFNHVDQLIDAFVKEDYYICVRLAKYLLSLPNDNFIDFLNETKINREELFYGSVNEGYYKLPAYQDNLRYLQKLIGL